MEKENLIEIFICAWTLNERNLPTLLLKLVVGVILIFAKETQIPVVRVPVVTVTLVTMHHIWWQIDFP